jgi:dUTP pyrophosphatase
MESAGKVQNRKQEGKIVMDIQINGNSLGEMTMVPVGAESGPADTVALETSAPETEPVKKKAGRPSNAEKAARAAAVRAEGEIATARTATQPIQQFPETLYSKDAPQVTQIKQSQGLSLGVFALNESAKLPEYATPGSGGFDIRANFDGVSEVTVYTSTNKKSTTAVRDQFGVKSVILQPRSRAMIPTGVIFDIPEGFKLEFSARSGLSLKEGLNLANGQALIDSDYVEESFILIQNTSDLRVEITHGDRIAQAALAAVVKAPIRALQERPGQKTTRAGGMGSTGVK